MIELTVIICLALAFYSYFGYPLLLWVFAKLSSSELLKSASPETLTVIIAARNEGEFIEAKLENTFEAIAKFNGSTQIIVASDQSEDSTDEIVEAAAGVILVRSEGPRGKEYAQRAAVQKATGDIIVFTDAKTKLAPDTLKNLVGYFSDPSIGAVSSKDSVLNAEQGGEGLYVKYEMLVRRLESRLNSLVGLSGSCFAVRREVCLDLRTDIPSDFGLLLAARAKGLRGVHADNALCFYKVVESQEREFSRKVRTVLRGITTFFSSFGSMNLQRDPLFAWQIISHKLFRWLVPWFILVSFLGTLFLASSSISFALLLLGFMAFFGVAILGHLEPSFREISLVKVPLFFCLTNSAIAVAWIKFLSGERTVTWEPTQRSKES